MINSDKKVFADLMASNGEIYNKSVSSSLMKIYFDTLEEYPIEDVKNAFIKHSLDPKHGSFFPKPADIARHIHKDTVEDKSALAWAQVIQCIRTEGAYGSLKLDDKQAIAAVRALGSWQQLCSTLEKDMTWKKKEFMSIYKTYENTPLDMLPSSLPGLIELQDHKKETNAVMKKIIAGIPKKLN